MVNAEQGGDDCARGGAKKAAVLFFFRLLDADGHGVNVAGPVGWVQPAW